MHKFYDRRYFIRGKSARMGMNKAFLEIEGKRLIDRAARCSRTSFRK